MRHLASNPRRPLCEAERLFWAAFFTLTLILADPANAACTLSTGPGTAGSPGTNAVVSCDTANPNPSATAVQAAFGSSNVSVTVQTGSGISVDSTAAVTIGNSSSAINYGSLTTTGSFAYGMLASGNSSTLTNNGTIVTTGGLNNGLYLYGNSNAAINTGTINASGFGIFAVGSGNAVTNSGSIYSSGTAAVAFGTGGTQSFINQSGGTVSVNASWYAIYSGEGTVLNVQNFGLISGNVYSAGASDSLFIGQGSSIVGNIFHNGTITINRTDNFNLAGNISGAASVNQSSTGTTILTGTNTYAGGTTISAGTLQLGNGGTTGSIVGNVTDNGVLTFSRSDAVAFSGAISGTGVVTQVGTGTTILTNANTYTGGTTISAGTLQLGSGGTTGSIVGNVTDNGVLAFNRSDAIAFGGTISGSGAVNQVGTGTTALTGTNTYTGPTTVTAGTLTISATGSITSNVTNSATFNNAGTVTGSLTNSGTASNSGIIANGLTNVAGTTTNTGTINGGATVNGGTLNTNAATSIVNGGLANAATVNAAGAVNGSIINAGAVTVTGALTSDHTFTNLSGGTLSLGAATYTLEGVLANNGMVSVASGGQLIATVGGITNYAGGSIAVAVGGIVRDDLNNGGLVTNNGSYHAVVATNTGTITNSGTWTGNVLSNTGTINNSSLWMGTITNAGTFNNNAGATVSGLLTNSGIVNNAGTLNGGLTNTAGTFNNTGSITGAVTITGGTLTGSGSFGATTIASGATIAPGNGMAGSSTTLNGSLALQSGATYLVQINPTTASFANVTGTATLGGATVNATYANGSYVSKQYTILSAAGGVSGTFNSLANTNLPTNFHTALGYDTTHAYLDLMLSFGIPGSLNGNQQSVGNALTSFFNQTGGIPTVFGALSPAALTQASGEIATGTQQATFNAMGLFMGLLTDPFVAGRGDGLASTMNAPQLASEGDRPSAYASADLDAYVSVYGIAASRPKEDLFEQRWAVWASGYGGSATTSGNAVLGSNTATSRVYGTAVGADYLFSPYTIAGFALAGGGIGFSVANAGIGRSDLFQAGAFVRHTVGAAYMTGALAYGWQDVTTNRTVTIAGIDQLQARFNSNAFSGRLEGGYRFATPWMGVTPYAAGQFTIYDLPAYAEQLLSGANTFALNYSSKDVTASRSELGVRTDQSYALTAAVLTLRNRFAWAHNFGSDPSIGSTFQTLPGASFVVNGTAQAHDAALATASAELKWRNGLSLAATFEGEFSSTTASYAGKGVARYVW